MSEQRRWTLYRHGQLSRNVTLDRDPLMSVHEVIEVCPVSELDAALAENANHRDDFAGLIRDAEGRGIHGSENAREAFTRLGDKYDEALAELAAERAAADRLAEALAKARVWVVTRQVTMGLDDTVHPKAVENIALDLYAVVEALAAHDARRQPATEGDAT